MHWVLLLGAVQEAGADYAVPYYGKGAARNLPAMRGPSRHQPACNNLALPIVNIFVLTGDIGSWG